MKRTSSLAVRLDDQARPTPLPHFGRSGHTVYTEKAVTEMSNLRSVGTANHAGFNVDILLSCAARRKATQSADDKYNLRRARSLLSRLVRLSGFQQSNVTKNTGVMAMSTVEKYEVRGVETLRPGEIIVL